MTGTSRQRAVISAFKMRPEAYHREIAAAAGVSVSCATQVIADYLESKERDKALVCQAPAVKKDVAVFQPDRRIGGFAGSGEPTETPTIKQQRLAVALAEHPRQDGEQKIAYCRRIAAIAGVHYTGVHRRLIILDCERIGRERSAAEAAKRVPVLASLNARAVQVPEFKGWADVFGRFKLLSEAYLKLAMARGDVYAQSFLKTLAENAERGEERSWLDQSTQ